MAKEIQKIECFEEGRTDGRKNNSKKGAHVLLEGRIISIMDLNKTIKRENRLMLYLAASLSRVASETFAFFFPYKSNCGYSDVVLLIYLYIYCVCIFLCLSLIFCDHLPLI